MLRPLAQRPSGRNLPRTCQICEFVIAKQPSLYKSSAKYTFATLGAGGRRVKSLQAMPKGALTLMPAMSMSRSHRFGPPKPTKSSFPEEAHAGASGAKFFPVPGQIKPVDTKGIATVVRVTRDQVVTRDGIPSEQDVLAALSTYKKAAGLVHSILSKHHLSRNSTEPDTAASSLLSLDESAPELTPSVAAEISQSPRPRDLINQISEAAYEIVSHPIVIITPRVLEAYVEVQARLGRAETLPRVLGLYASKPKPRGNPGSLQYVKQNPSKAANAVDPNTAEKALDAAIEAKSLDAAIGVIENSYATKAFLQAKLLKKALLPVSAVVATPLAVYILASNLSHLQSSFDHKTATFVATAGILAYVAFTGSMGLVATVTQNDHMKRVTWAPGISLTKRWMREEERAALDKVACSFGFSQAHRYGEEEGTDFQALREFVLRKGMVLDRVELMEGMN